jgi:hypothetical protein
MRAVDGFGWATDTVLDGAACLTLAEPGSVLAVAAAFGGDPARARALPLARAGDEFAGVPWVAVRAVDSWVLAVELNGWQGSRPEVLERVAAGGRAVSAYWNVNGQTQFSYAAAGQVLTAFDAVFPGRRTGAEPDVLVPAMDGLPWEDALPVPLLLALAARVTGTALQPSWLDGAFQVFPVEVLAEAVDAGIDPDTEELTYDHPLLAWELRRAAEPRQRAAALAAAQHAIGLAGLAGDPAVALGLMGVPEADGPLRKLAARLDRACRKSAGDPRPMGRFCAVTALRAAASPSALAAGFQAVTAAEGTAAAFGDRPAALSEVVMAALGDPPPPIGSLGLTAAAGPRPADRYRWTAAHWLAPCGCITFVRQWSAGATVRAFGGPAGAPVRGRPGLYDPLLAAVRDQDGWAVVTEARELPGLSSRYGTIVGTQAVSVSWSARGRSLFHYVADGRFVATFDPQRPEQRDGDDPAMLDDYLADLPPGSWPDDAARCLPLLLVLAERVTGLAYAPELLDEEQLLAALPARPDRA